MNRALAMAALLSFLSLPAQARQDGTPPAVPSAPHAFITEVTGTVTVWPVGAPEPVAAEEDMELGEGDRVVTAVGGHATLSFLDNHFVNLDERSTITIRTLHADTAAGTFWARISLATGKLFASIASLTGGNSGFEVETPTAVAAVKGTAFAVEASASTSTISVLEGAVATSGVGPTANEAVSVKEGFEASVDRKSGRPGALRKFFNDAKRHKHLVKLTEFRARAQRLRSQGRSGELGNMRKMRRLVRAVFMQDFMRKNPGAYRALPAWRKERLDRFLAACAPDLETQRPAIEQFLAKHPLLRARLEQEARSRFAAPKGRTRSARSAKTRKPGAARPPAARRRTAANP